MFSFSSNVARWLGLRLIPQGNAMEVSTGLTKASVEPCEAARRLQISSSVAPIHQLPVELLLDIFDTACRTEWDRKINSKARRAKRNDLHIPLLLRQVCSRWQSLVDNSPLLWARVSISLAHHTNVEHHTRLLRLYLARSKKSLLSIRIQQDRAEMHIPSHHDAYQKAFSAIMDVLAPHSERWREISLYIPGSQPSPSFAGIQGRVPYLESLDLQMSTARVTTLRPIELTMFSIAPRLSKVTYPSVSQSVHLAIDWSTVSTLACRTIAFADAVSILQNASNLVRCALTVVHYTRGESDDIAAIRLPLLRCLSLRENCRWAESPLLDLLDSPGLKNLHTNVHDTSSPTLVNFLARSSCKPVVVIDEVREAIFTKIQGTIAKELAKLSAPEAATTLC